MVIHIFMQLIVSVYCLTLLFKNHSKYLVTDYTLSKPPEDFLHVSKQLCFTQFSILLSPKRNKWIKTVAFKICV